MKVHGPARPVPVEKTHRSAHVRGAAPARTAAPQERVTLSPVAQSLMDAQGPEVPDQDRISRLREAIQSGTFEIDPLKIARRMLVEEV